MAAWTNLPSVPLVKDPGHAILLQGIKANLEQLKPLLDAAGTSSSTLTRAKLWFVAS